MESEENLNKSQKSASPGGQNRDNNQGGSQNRKPSRRRYYGRRRRYSRNDREKSKSSKVTTSFKKISIVIPLYNEEESLHPLTNEIRKVMSTISGHYDVLFVDDGSTDSSLNKLKEICKTDRRFKYISFRKNYGKSAALQLGFKEVNGDAIITMDADLQDDPKEIPNLLKKLDEGFDLCSGWKRKRQDPFIKKVSSRFFNFVTRIITGIRIHDFNCGLKAYRKDVAKSINVHGELHRYMPVLTKWQGFSVTESIVKHYPRRYGVTKFGTSRFFKGFIDLITVTFSTRYIKRPLHFFGFFGALAFLAGFTVLGYLTVLWLQGQSLSNRPIIFLGMLLIIVGVQLFSIGLLGEMLVHNTSDDSEYIIKEKS